MYFVYSEYISNLYIMSFMYFVLFYLNLESVMKFIIIIINIIVISLSVYSLLYDNNLKEWISSQNIGSV